MKRMYCGASGDDLGLISLATGFNPRPRYHVLRVVGHVAAFFGCLATLGAILGMVAFR